VSHLFTKEISVEFVRHFIKIAVLLIAAVSLTGCVVLPWGWGRGGHGHGEGRYYDSDRGQSRGHDARDESRRRAP
jgi:hypothetical protein